MKSTEKFTDKGEVYAKYRPGYPNEYIAYLLAATKLNENSIIADIGSGTGIFSRQLLERNLTVIGVEPNDDMREKAEQSQFYKDGNYDFKSFRNDLELDFEGFIGRYLSASYSPKKTEKEYEHFITSLSSIFKKYSNHGQIVFPNITRSYLGRV